jgi:hypothetical protein
MDTPRLGDLGVFGGQVIHTDELSVFLSCSFRPDDATMNEIIQGLCAGLGLNCINISFGFAALPPQQAREYITKAHGLIAICSRRDRLEEGEYAMPSAVREEIAFAFALGKPILILGEEGVRFDGFMNNYGTRLMFDRADLYKPELLRKLVFSLRIFKQNILTGSTHTTQQYAGEYFIESWYNLVALELRNDKPMWIHSATKLLKFEAKLQREILTRVWPSVPLQVAAHTVPGEWQLKIHNSSRPFAIQTTVRTRTADHLELSLRIRPDPQPGDYIEFTRSFSSPYINPVCMDDLIDKATPALEIEGREYFGFDGVTPMELTKKLHMHFSFPESYGLNSTDVAAFVAGYGVGVNYLAPWESKRVASEIRSFGGYLVADMQVDDPLQVFFYGLAWVPPSNDPFKTRS